VRDQGLLTSALAKPRQLYAYGEKPDIVALSAAYTFGIVRYHPFMDGYKRAGLVIGIVFLEVNGYRFTASEEDAAQAVMGLAVGTLGEEGFAAWLRANVKREKRGREKQK
jgi:death-on-curing protein